MKTTGIMNDESNGIVLSPVSTTFAISTKIPLHLLREIDLLDIIYWVDSRLHCPGNGWVPGVVAFAKSAEVILY